MSRAEAAAKWAEAKEALEKAALALDAAHKANNEAARAEAEAWEALQESRGVAQVDVLEESEGQKRFWPRGETTEWEGKLACPDPVREARMTSKIIG